MTDICSWNARIFHTNMTVLCWYNESKMIGTETMPKMSQNKYRIALIITYTAMNFHTLPFQIFVHFLPTIMCQFQMFSLFTNYFQTQTQR